MARARNNIARLPYTVRCKISELYLNGSLHEEIRTIIKKDFPDELGNRVLHGTSFLAFFRSDEHKENIIKLQESKAFFENSDSISIIAEDWKKLNKAEKSETAAFIKRILLKRYK